MCPYPQFHMRPRPRSPRTPTAQDYEDSPGAATPTSSHNPTTFTHAISSAKGQGPAQGQWWQRWTHKQLWELPKWARAEPSLEDLVQRPRKGSVENCRLRPAGRGGCHRPHGKPCWPMRSSPKESTRATYPRHRTTRMSSGDCGGTLQETRREGRRLWDITPSPTLCRYTPSPARKRRRTDTGSTHSMPGAQHATQHQAPDPVEKTPSKPEADGRQCEPQPAPLRPTAPNPSPQPSKPANPTQPPSPSGNFIRSQTRAAPRNL